MAATRTAPPRSRKAGAQPPPAGQIAECDRTDCQHYGACALTAEPGAVPLLGGAFLDGVLIRLCRDPRTGQLVQQCYTFEGASGRESLPATVAVQHARRSTQEEYLFAADEAAAN